jgi:ABC transporter substrate binding protein
MKPNGSWTSKRHTNPSLKCSKRLQCAQEITPIFARRPAECKFKGTKPAELPIERASKFQFVLNLKTAKALAVEVPAATLLRADEVID